MREPIILAALLAGALSWLLWLAIWIGAASRHWRAVIIFNRWGEQWGDMAIIVVMLALVFIALVILGKRE